MDDFTRYDDVLVGDVFPKSPLAFQFDEAVVAAFRSVVSADDDVGKNSGERKTVPSMIAAVYLIDLLAARRSPPGGVHAKQAMKFHRPVRMGEILSIQGTVVDKYLRKERPYVVASYEARGEDGSLVSTGIITTIWGKDQ
jgi:3-hydroxybutyryl-CoA dehydratase